MGFDLKLAKEALKKGDNDLEIALDKLKKMSKKEYLSHSINNIITGTRNNLPSSKNPLI
jgi:hypothetical protein